MSKKYRVAVIGATGRGNYGHGLDEAFQGVEGTELVAVADADAKGLAAAGAKLDVSSLWADYRQMLGAEKPDIAVVCPGWVSERVPMIEAAAAAGCHIYCEKPVAGTLAEADAIVAACQDMKVAVAHQWRGMPPIQQTITDVRAGAYGRPLRLRARPKDDNRGGGEEFLLHGTHLFDLMVAFVGPPRWASGHVSEGVYASHLAGGQRIPLPLADRTHPLVG